MHGMLALNGVLKIFKIMIFVWFCGFSYVSFITSNKWQTLLIFKVATCNKLGCKFVLINEYKKSLFFNHSRNGEDFIHWRVTIIYMMEYTILYKVHLNNILILIDNI
jgi:hypothetical protein